MTTIKRFNGIGQYLKIEVIIFNISSNTLYYSFIRDIHSAGRQTGRLRKIYPDSGRSADSGKHVSNEYLTELPSAQRPLYYQVICTGLGRIRCINLKF